MKIPRSILILAAFFLSTAKLAHAKDHALVISGNERTQNSYIKRLTESCLEQQESDRPGQSPEAKILEQCLLNSRLFSEVKVISENEEFKIAVKDKWTLLPIPSFSAGSGDTKSAGLIIFESNFLGVGMNLAMAAVTSNKGDTFFLNLTDPSIFFSDWSYSISASKQALELVSKVDEKEVDGIHENTVSFKGSLGRKFGRWNLSAMVSNASIDYKPSDEYSVPEDNDVTRVGTTLTFDGKNYRLYFSEGLGLNVSYQKDTTRSDEQKLASQITSRIEWQKLIVGETALQLGLTGGLVEGGTRADIFRLGGGSGMRGIEPSTNWTNRYYAFSADYQIPLYTFDSGVLTTAPFVDLGRTYRLSDSSEYIDYSSAGIGIYYYLKQIALPGLGFQIGYNEKFQKQFFAVSVGFSR